ncbi:tetratricopeptide repeat protein [Dactylosporangium sucinum]|uniref:DUF7779 domain-containing protein n=1 Tax=Dactylosporangium sucinum TaxID=1424081 RepID=A0A917UC01_9ACTN|nr:tetratricopeptide repeat protein [Dactylosporangium sucinum]GGM78708.1 hypothetical protein GCM10007977_095380 [Dactylosporangium sucinum]
MTVPGAVPKPRTDGAVVASHGGIAVGTLQYQQRVAAGDPMRLDPRPGQVVGRDALLAEVGARLAAAPRPGVVALCGLGGVGKTTAALEYAYRHLDGYDLVWMFHAEEATGLLAQFHELAELLDPAGLLAQPDPVARVHGALARLPRRWLLVFDNVRDHAAVRRWLPPQGTGHVLVTTRDGHWPASQAVHLGGLTRAAAARFLLDLAGEYDTASAEAIAEQLGGLPLALAQAGGFVASTGRSLADYLELLRRNRAGVLERGVPSEHRASVIATWGLAFDELAATSPGSIALLRLLSCLAPEDIPFRLLLDDPAPVPDAVPDAVRDELQRLRDAPFGLDDAVAGLRRHSLIGPPSAVVSVHRLVQAVTLDQLHPDDRAAWTEAAVALVEAAIPDDVMVPEAWPRCAQLLPHALAVVDPAGWALGTLASFLRAAGDYATARTVSERRLEALRGTLGAEHPEALTVAADLALYVGEAGHEAEARDRFAALLPLLDRVLGAESPNALNARIHHAFYIGAAGDAARARDLLATAMPTLERVLGPENADTLAARDILANNTGEAGDAVRARELYEALLPIRERVSGPENWQTLIARSNLARWTGEAGDPAGARDQYAALVPVGERTLGREHPTVLFALAGLAAWTGEAGDPARARDMFEALLPVRQRVLGPEHPNTQATRAGLDHWTRLAAGT